MVECIDEAQALVEPALSLGRTRRDPIRVAAECVVEHWAAAVGARRVWAVRRRLRGVLSLRRAASQKEKYGGRGNQAVDTHMRSSLRRVVPSGIRTQDATRPRDRNPQFDTMFSFGPASREVLVRRRSARAFRAHRQGDRTVSAIRARRDRGSKWRLSQVLAVREETQLS